MAAVLAIAALLLAVALLPVEQWALSLAGRARGAGLAGGLAFGVGYVVAVVLFVPASLLTLTAGFAYGPLLGTLVVWPAASVAATISFLLGRTLARDWIGRRIEGNRTFAAIDRAMERGGLRVVLLLRLSPVFPFNLLNYGLGLTRVRLRDYVLGTVFGMLPGTAMYVYLGSLVTSAASLAQGKPAASGGLAPSALYWGGLLATVAVTVLLTRLARQELRRDLEAEGAPTADDSEQEAAGS